MDRAVLYLRVSTDEQVRGGVSLNNQEEKLLAYCKMQGIEPARIIREEGISAAKPLSARPGGQELLQLVKQKKVNHIVALKLDRLFRDAEDALRETKAWDKKGVTMHLVDMGGQTLNTASAMGRFFLNTMAGFAELERNLISERTKSALSYKKSHKEVYNHLPFGYDKEGGKLVPNEEELKAVQQMKKWRAAGWALQRICNELTKKGIKTKRGGGWAPATVHYILSNGIS